MHSFPGVPDEKDGEIQHASARPFVYQVRRVLSSQRGRDELEFLPHQWTAFRI